MIMSVFAPLLSVTLYLNGQPRDWHLLAFGVAVGLLFLAAARGLARQEIHQRDTYFHLSLRVFQYERYVSALRIVVRGSGMNPDDVRKLGDRIVEELLRAERATVPPMPGLSREEEPKELDSPVVQLISTAIGRQA
jgi:hypothetical protein